MKKIFNVEAIDQDEIIYHKILVAIWEIQNAYGNTIPVTIVKGKDPILSDPSIEDIGKIFVDNESDGWNQKYNPRDYRIIAVNHHLEKALWNVFRMMNLIIHGRIVNCTHGGCSNYIVTTNPKVQFYTCPYHSE